MPAATSGGRRSYSSAHRREQAARTRELVVAAATELFAGRGWSGTSVRDVARSAGVSVETVYASVGAKSDLLLAAIDVGVVGDAEPVPLSQRPEYAALAEGDLDRRIAAAARMTRGINERSWGLRRAIAEAAVTEPLLADKQRWLEQRRRDNIEHAARMVLGRDAEDDELDLLWVALNAETFVLLTQVGGRSVASYEQWLVRTLHALAARPGR